jgi:hypothetical protein
MTTGRINQVTILNAAASRPRRHPARAGQSSCTDGGRGPRPAGSLERCYNRALPAIRLPPLSFPRDRPPHRGRAPERYRRVWPGPLRGRIPSAGPRPRRDGSLLGLAPDCLGRVVPSGQPSTDSNRARTPGRAGRRAPPQAHRGRWGAASAVDRCLRDRVGQSRPRAVSARSAIMRPWDGFRGCTACGTRGESLWENTIGVLRPRARPVVRRENTWRVLLPAP